MARQMMMSVMEAAKIMGTNPEIIRARLVTGRIPKSLTFKIGRRRYFDKKALMDWIEAQREGDPK